MKRKVSQYYEVPHWQRQEAGSFWGFQKRVQWGQKWKVTRGVFMASSSPEIFVAYTRAGENLSAEAGFGGQTPGRGEDSRVRNSLSPKRSLGPSKDKGQQVGGAYKERFACSTGSRALH